MTDAEIEGLRELCEKATPEGEWYCDVAFGDSMQRINPSTKIMVNKNCAWSVGPCVRSRLQANNDMALCLAARTAMPRLIKEVERLKGEVRRYRDALWLSLDGDPELIDRDILGEWNAEDE